MYHNAAPAASGVQNLVVIKGAHIFPENPRCADFVCSVTTYSIVRVDNVLFHHFSDNHTKSCVPREDENLQMITDNIIFCLSMVRFLAHFPG